MSLFAIIGLIAVALLVGIGIGIKIGIDKTCDVVAEMEVKKEFGE